MDYRIKRNRKRKQKQFLSNISLFLLGRSEVAGQFWNIKSVNYDKNTQRVNIGIDTIDGQLGTTLDKLRKICKPLSDYLFEQGLTFRRTHVNFFVDKSDQEHNRILGILEKIEEKDKSAVKTNKIDNQPPANQPPAQSSK